MDQEHKRLVLVLGGSTFMGKTLLQMLAHLDTYEVHYVNRGKQYWDNEVLQIKNVHYTYGNRDDTQDYTKVRYLY
jgi:hypothetical protein